MKRLIPSLPTREDRLIWMRLNLPLGKPVSRVMVSAGYHESDRTDAELMLAWRRVRIFSRKQMHRPNVWWLRDESEPRWQPIGGQLP